MRWTSKSCSAATTAWRREHRRADQPSSPTRPWTATDVVDVHDAFASRAFANQIDGLWAAYAGRGRHRGERRRLQAGDARRSRDGTRRTVNNALKGDVAFSDYLAMKLGSYPRLSGPGQTDVAATGQHDRSRHRCTSPWGGWALRIPTCLPTWGTIIDRPVHLHAVAVGISARCTVHDDGRFQAARTVRDLTASRTWSSSKV